MEDENNNILANGKSGVWKYFKKEKSDDGKTYTYCQVTNCKEGTSSLIIHMSMMIVLQALSSLHNQP